eukprot:4782092-Amphidinium_carterae.2
MQLLGCCVAAIGGAEKLAGLKSGGAKKALLEHTPEEAMKQMQQYSHATYAPYLDMYAKRGAHQITPGRQHNYSTTPWNAQSICKSTAISPAIQSWQT